MSEYQWVVTFEMQALGLTDEEEPIYTEWELINPDTMTDPEDQDELGMHLARMYPATRILEILEAKKVYEKQYFAVEYDKFHGEVHTVIQHVGLGWCVRDIVEQLEKDFSVVLLADGHRQLTEFMSDAGSFYWEDEWCDETRDTGMLYNLSITTCAPDWVYEPSLYKPGHRPVEMCYTYESRGVLCSSMDLFWVSVRFREDELEEAGRNAIEAQSSIAGYIGAFLYHIPDWDLYKSMEPV